MGWLSVSVARGRGGATECIHGGSGGRGPVERGALYRSLNTVSMVSIGMGQGVEPDGSRMLLTVFFWSFQKARRSSAAALADCVFLLRARRLTGRLLVWLC